MSCQTDKRNLGFGNCNEFPSLIKTMIWTPDGFTIPKATADDPALLKTYIQDAILDGKALRIYKWPDMDKVEDVSEAKVRVNLQTGRTIPVREGLKRWNFGISQNLCFHKAAFSQRTRKGRVLLIDVNLKYFGTISSDGTTVSGFKVSLLDTDSLKFNDGANPSESPIFLELASPNEMNQSGYMGDASFIDELAVLTDVTLTLVSASTTKVVVKATLTCDSETVVNGLVAADFTLLKADGTAQTITSATEADGTYTLNGSSLVTGSVALKAADTLSVPGYEQYGGPTTVTVPFP